MPAEPPWPQENRNLLYGNWDRDQDGKASCNQVGNHCTWISVGPVSALDLLCHRGSLGCHLGTISREED